VGDSMILRIFAMVHGDKTMDPEFKEMFNEFKEKLPSKSIYIDSGTQCTTIVGSMSIVNICVGNEYGHLIIRKTAYALKDALKFEIHGKDAYVFRMLDVINDVLSKHGYSIADDEDLDIDMLD
jgi:hypothetical protein